MLHEPTFAYLLIYLQMNSASGMLTTRRLLDPSAVGTHSLRVIASDSGNPALTGTCELFVHFTGVYSSSSSL